MKLQIFLLPLLVLCTLADSAEVQPASMVCPPPTYPKQSRTKEEEGTVLLKVKVSRTAEPTEILIEKSSGYVRLDTAAVELIPNCEFKAGRNGSETIDSFILQRLTFRLTGESNKKASNRSNDQITRDEISRRIERINASSALSSDSYPNLTYANKIQLRIKPNIVFGENIDGNPSALVEVRCAADGKIIGVRLIESSGYIKWDEAVLKAVVKSEQLPKDLDEKVPPVLTISFRPNN